MLNVIYFLPVFKNDKIEFNHKIRKKKQINTGTSMTADAEHTYMIADSDYTCTYRV